MTARDALAGIKARAEATTGSRWEVKDWDRGTAIVLARTGPLDWQTVTGEMSTPDANFTAYARSDVPRLVAAVEAVLDLHSSVGYRVTGGYHYGCANEDCKKQSRVYPCPTVRAITAALEAT